MGIKLVCGVRKSNLISSVYLTLGKMPKTSPNKPKISFHRFFFPTDDNITQGKIPHLLQSSLFSKSPFSFCSHAYWALTTPLVLEVVIKKVGSLVLFY